MTDDLGREAMTMVKKAEVLISAVCRMSSLISPPPVNLTISLALLMGADGAFITGSDFLMDGGVTAAFWFGSANWLRNEGARRRSFVAEMRAVLNGRYGDRLRRAPATSGVEKRLHDTDSGAAVSKRKKAYADGVFKIVENNLMSVGAESRIGRIRMGQE